MFIQVSICKRGILKCIDTEIVKEDNFVVQVKLHGILWVLWSPKLGPVKIRLFFITYNQDWVLSRRSIKAMSVDVLTGFSNQPVGL